MTVRCLAIGSKTGLVQGEIPFESCTITHRLNRKGSWSLSAPMRFLSPLGVETLGAEAFDVNRSGVVFLRGGVPLFTGLLETENGEVSEDAEESFQVGGPDLALGYLARRLLLSNYSATVDQFTHVTNLLALAASFGVPTSLLFEPASVSGVVRTRNYYASDRKLILDLLSEMSAVEDGFDFVAGVSGTQAAGFSSTVTLGYPRLQRTTGLVLQLGKNVSRVSYSKDGRQYANYYQVGGMNRAEDNAPLGSAINVGDLTTYPYLHRTESRSTVQDIATLNMHAARGLRLYSKAPTEYTVEVAPDDPDCAVGSFRCGDTLRLILKRGRLSVDSTYRIVEWTLSVDADGRESMKVTLMLASDVT